MLQTVARDYPFANWFIAQETLPCGINMMDYVNLIDYLRSSKYRRLDPVPSSEGRLFSIEELRRVFGEARRDLVNLFASTETYNRPITLEDIYLMNVAAYESHVQPVLQWSKLPPESHCNFFTPQGSQGLVQLLADLGTLVAISPAPTILTDWFIADPEDWNFVTKSLSSCYMLMTKQQIDITRFEGRLNEWFRSEFSRFDRWITAYRILESSSERKTGSYTSLSEIDFPQSVAMVAKDPVNLSATLRDTVKNWYTASGIEYANDREY